MAVGERNSVLPAYRGTGALDEMLAYSEPFIASYDLPLVFGCCEPHLLSLYLKMGCGRTPNTTSTVRRPATSSRLSRSSPTSTRCGARPVDPGPGELPACMDAVLARGGSCAAEALSEFATTGATSAARWTSSTRSGFTTFDGFTDDEAQRCIARSTIIECAKGDRVLKRGGTARNIFVVLNGTLEVRDGDPSSTC